MLFRFAIRMLAGVSGAIACTVVLAGGTALPALNVNADSAASGNLPQQLQDGVIEDVGPSPPVIDNILKQGIKMPEEAGTAVEIKEDDARGEDGEQE